MHATCDVCILTVLDFMCISMECVMLRMYVHAQNYVQINHCFT